uniref:Uncharacterized protein n=1 Tax=Medicago truncatula TaxID=3880 RepID=A2Q1B7_MEDTR|nr:hypothetical protein MtrDRAFT_AC148762g35v2 [Medicago truncatula]ABN08931.1 hypothetical protein MtrDRAFT_AC166313g30v2 [Medicago truncatula]
MNTRPPHNNHNQNNNLKFMKNLNTNNPHSCQNRETIVTTTCNIYTSSDIT